ncbi:MAG: hypothetical protein ACEY3J_04800 [Arsenophonus sp.]
MSTYLADMIKAYRKNYGGRTHKLVNKKLAISLTNWHKKLH